MLKAQIRPFFSASIALLHSSNFPSSSSLFRWVTESLSAAAFFILALSLSAFSFHAVTSIPKDSSESLLGQPLRQTARKGSSTIVQENFVTYARTKASAN
jgi:hypothetical protein